MTVYIPVSFPDIDNLVLGTNLKADKIRILLHQMYLSRLSQSGYTGKQKKNVLNYFYDEGYISLNSKLLKRLLCSYYNDYIKFLVEKKLLSTRSSPFSERAYLPHLTSIHYKLASKLFHSPDTLRHFRKETISDKCTIRAVLKARDEFKLQSSKSTRSIPLESIHEDLFEMEQQVRFDLTAAEAWAKNFFSEEVNNLNYSEREKDKVRSILADELELINSINEGLFNIKVDQFGERLHSPLKRVSRRMRPFMYFEGHKEKELMCLDISNSQLYFSTFLFDPVIVNSIIPEFSIITEHSQQYIDEVDFKEFVSCSINGTIYTVWQAIRHLESRDIAKKELITILFSRSTNTMPGAKIFKVDYSSIRAFFDKIKSFDERQLPFILKSYLDKNEYYKENSLHCNLSCAVQRLESRIFIKRIGQALIDNGIKPFFTIHDSVYFPKSLTEKVQQIILNEFQLLNVTPPKLKLSTP